MEYKKVSIQDLFEDIFLYGDEDKMSLFYKSLYLIKIKHGIFISDNWLSVPIVNDAYIDELVIKKIFKEYRIINKGKALQVKVNNIDEITANLSKDSFGYYMFGNNTTSNFHYLVGIMTREFNVTHEVAHKISVYLIKICEDTTTSIMYKIGLNKIEFKGELL